MHLLDAIQQFDTCTIANAIESFQVRLRNEGLTRPGLRCVTMPGARILGYAATFRIRTSEPPVSGKYYLERTDWWDAIRSVPAPRVAVFQDLDATPGTGAIVGEIHAAILQALQCKGLITNGVVRDIPAVAALHFPMFASMIGVSHAYVHMLDYGAPVEIFGLKIRSGDLLFADCHGVLSIPQNIAADLPEAAARIRAQEERIVKVCQSPEFDTEKLLDAIRGVQI